MNKHRKIFTNLVISGVLGGIIVTNSAPIVASAQENDNSSYVDLEQQGVKLDSGYEVVNLSEQLSQEDKVFMEKLETIYSEFHLNENNELVLLKSASDLKSEYGLNNQDIEKISEMISFQKENSKIKQSSESQDNMISPMLHVSDWKVYFTNNDLKMYLSSAVQAGAPAVVAALAALGTTVATPGVGTVIGVAIGLYGASTIMYQVTQALANGQGWYLGVSWNGIFPNPDSGTW